MEQEKHCMITGANRGIGLEFVRQFAAAGYHIWACARKYHAEFEEEMAAIAQKNKIEIKPVYFNMTSETEIADGLKRILGEKKKIDVLINNAGVAHGGLLTMTPISKIREVYEVNVFAQLQIMQMVARVMMRQKEGCIINMCSVGGIEANPGYIAYGSSKAALLWITRAMSKELGAFGIRVNGIAPGLIDTEMGHYKTKEELEKVFSKMTIKRMGTAEEVAKAALYLVSDGAAYMTGQVLILDGGRV